MLRGILFDFNGVLLDDERLHFELFRQLLREQGVDLDESAYYRELVQFDDAEGFRHALAAQGRDSELIAELCRRKALRYQEMIAAAGYPMFPGAIELVRAGAKAGLALGVVSGALCSEIVPALRHAGLERWLQVVVAAEDVEASKPDPAGYLLGLEALNARQGTHVRPLEPAEVLAIEDTDGGIQAARGAGLLTLGVAHTLPAERLVGAHLAVDSLVGLDLELLEQQLSAF